MNIELGARNHRDLVGGASGHERIPDPIGHIAVATCGSNDVRCGGVLHGTAHELTGGGLIQWNSSTAEGIDRWRGRAWLGREDQGIITAAAGSFEHRIVVCASWQAGEAYAEVGITADVGDDVGGGVEDQVGQRATSGQIDQTTLEVWGGATITHGKVRTSGRSEAFPHHIGHEYRIRGGILIVAGDGDRCAHGHCDHRGPRTKSIGRYAA